MDWQARMERAINWLEGHLEETDYGRAAREANSSTFHFMRMFEIVTGITPAEYVRRRRLSRAAVELTRGDVTVLGVALKYGYESPDSFARAFRREFDCLPSEARKEGVRLHLYPPLAFSVVLQGDKAMEYRIKKGPELKMTGLSFRISSAGGENYTSVPACWDRVMEDGRWKQLIESSAGSTLGVVGVCHAFNMEDGTFTYSIALETPADRSKLPEGCEDFAVPASTWAKFTSRGPLRPNFQNTIKRIWSEWFPSSGREHAGTAEIEYYGTNCDPDAADYWCEYWVPLK